MKKPTVLKNRRSTPEEVARVLGVSKKRLKELIAICSKNLKENK